MADRKTSAPWIACAVLLVLIGGYAAAYYAAVSPEYVMGPGFDPVPFYFGRSTVISSWEAAFFAPIHWLDRGIRPQVWEQ